MTRRQWILAFLLTFCALALVNARYHERRLYAQMDRVDRSIQKLESDIESLGLELTSLRNPARIDTAARRDLNMLPIKPTEILYFNVSRDGRPSSAGNP